MEMHGTIMEWEDTILQQQDDFMDLEAKVLKAKVPREVDIVTRSSGGKTWPSFVFEMALELLAHHTPPSCISPNILTIASTLLSG